MVARRSRRSPDALTFDMDGLLLDTQRVERAASEAATKSPGRSAMSRRP